MEQRAKAATKSPGTMSRFGPSYRETRHWAVRSGTSFIGVIVAWARMGISCRSPTLMMIGSTLSYNVARSSARRVCRQ